ncbi:MAG: amidase [Bacteroidia bacterium]
MEKRVNAFTNDALGNMDATAIAEAIATKKISVAEAVEAAITRAEKVNGELNAIVIKMYDDARKASQQKAGGGLHGVPTFIKDTDGIKGYPTQLGTGALKVKPAKGNSKFVNQFLSTGVVNLGKTTLPEFGLICSTENERWGITRNPWNTDYTTGGSSSGSAAMVASGVVPIASANDGAGSIRIPAAICGLVGLKPSRHRLHGVDGAEAMPVQLVHQGVLTRTVRDTALFYSEAEKYYSSARMPKMGHVQHASKQRLRIAFFENLPAGKTANQDTETYRVQNETAALLQSLGHHVEQVPFPLDVETMVNHFLNYYGFFSYMMSHWPRLALKGKVDRSLLEPFTTGLADRFKANALKLPMSIRAMKRIGTESEKLFHKYDVLMSPVLSHKTPKIGYFSPQLSSEEVTKRAVDFASYTGLNNVTGAPAISLPLGVDSDGMPLGVHFSAPYGLDKRLIELAYELEEAKPWRFIYNA